MTDQNRALRLVRDELHLASAELRDDALWLSEADHGEFSGWATQCCPYPVDVPVGDFLYGVPIYTRAALA